MIFRTLIGAVSAMTLAATVVFALLFGSNVEAETQSVAYAVAFWVAAIGLVLLVFLVIAAVLMRRSGGRS